MIDHRELLREAIDPEYAEFTAKLIPGKEGIIGVRSPDMKRIAKLIIKDDWEAFLREEPTNFEENNLKGLVIATAKMDDGIRLRYTEDYIDSIDNWATCDMFCAAWKFSEKSSSGVYDYFASLMDSGEEYRMRVSLVFRMDHFIDEDHIQDILKDIISYDHEGYYYKMGAAWAMSVCFVKFPEQTYDALRSDSLDDWICNKSIQKIRESYRVSDEDKMKVKTLKR